MKRVINHSKSKSISFYFILISFIYFYFIFIFILLFEVKKRKLKNVLFIFPNDPDNLGQHIVKKKGAVSKLTIVKFDKNLIIKI